MGNREFHGGKPPSTPAYGMKG